MREKANNQLAVFDTSSELNKKWPWSRPTANANSRQDKQHPSADSLRRQVVLDPVLLQEAAKFEVARGGAGLKEPFQVVWSQLAFEVDRQNYDHLLGGFADRVKSIFPCSSSSPPSASSSASFSEKGSNKDIIGSNAQLTTTTAHHQSSSSIRSSTSGGRRAQKRRIFENLNGHINSGEISAILGPSGVGKTSLINAICSKAKANYRGQVQLIGGAASRMRVSVIPQKDYLVDRLTVKENLLFASRMLNPDEGFDHEANILRLAKMLHLLNCIDSSTGSISGGEYKRVSIAQELLKRPDILILDEPTSGLDSVNCKNLIKSLRSLISASRCGAINPIAIVLTIHQPDVEIFHMFDHIYCMARGGRTVYEGHPSKALEVIQSLSGIDEQTCDSPFANMNPANLLIEIASEFVYGSGPIERLNAYQLKQFEHQRLVSASSSSRSANGQPQQQLSRSWPNHLTSIGGCEKSLATPTPTNIPEEAVAAIPLKSTASPSPSSYSVHSLAASTASSASTTASSTPSSMDTAAGTPTDHRTSSGRVAGTATAAAKKSFIRDKRLNSKVDHSGKFLHQMSLLIRRNFIADMRDPLTTGASVMFHLTIPFVMWIAYSRKIGKATACPVIHREMELLALASNGTANKVSDLQEEFTVALECSTMFFMSTYCFSLRSMLIAALSFPLSMHVLLKESRNGWYNVPAYVLAKTVSSFLTEVMLPVTSVIMIYYIMGMPQSPYQWRLWALALVMALVSLVSAGQGLIWGALMMDNIQSAIFMASASSLPLVLLSGFTARIKQMPLFMQYLSWLSPYRYSSDATNIIRFGFGLCACDSRTDEYLRTKPASFADLPERMKPLFSFYLVNQGDADAPTELEAAAAANVSAAIVSAATNSSVDQQIAGVSYDLLLSSPARSDMLKRLESGELDLFSKMAELLAKSFTYGRQITGCDSMRSQLLVIGGFPEDNYLPGYYAGLALMFVLMNILLFLVVRYKVNKRV